MRYFEIPKYDEASESSRKYFDFFNLKLGSIPNLYGMLSHSGAALEAYFNLHHQPQSLSIIERAIIGIVVATENKSVYCLETHMMIAKLNGISDDQISQIRKGNMNFNDRYQRLAEFTKAMVAMKGKPGDVITEQFLHAGYSLENFVDVILCIADNTFTNMLTCSMHVPSDDLPTKIATRVE